MRLVPLVMLLVACDPYRRWPDPLTVFPWVYTPEDDVEPYEAVRVETETWVPLEDPAETGLYILKAANHRPGAADETLAHFEAMRPQLPPLGAGLQLDFVGDIMRFEGGWETFAEGVAPMLDGDHRIGNLETPTSPLHPTDTAELRKISLYAFNSPPALLDGLPVDSLQLTNNHAMDMGDEGLEATVAEVVARGIHHTGVDEHVVVDVAGQEVALLSFTWGLNVPEPPSSHELFVVPFGHLDPELDLGAVESALSGAEDADFRVVLLHWGFEYEYYADPYFLQLARKMVEAGADVVVGTGPHVVQPPEICAVNDPDVLPGVGTCSVRSEDGEPRTAAILYSLGNFGTDMGTIPCQVGLIGSVSLSEGGVTGLGWQAVASTREEGLQRLVPLGDLAGDPRYDDESTRLDTHLGTGWKR